MDRNRRLDDWGGGTSTVNSGGRVFENHLTITAGTNEIQANGLVQLSMTGLTMNGGTVTIDSDPTTPGKLALMSNVMANDSTTSTIATSGTVGAASAGNVDLTGSTRDLYHRHHRQHHDVECFRQHR